VESCATRRPRLRVVLSLRTLHGQLLLRAFKGLREKGDSGLFDRISSSRERWIAARLRCRDWPCNPTLKLSRFYLLRATDPSIRRCSRSGRSCSLKRFRDALLEWTARVAQLERFSGCVILSGLISSISAHLILECRTCPRSSLWVTRNRVSQSALKKTMLSPRSYPCCNHTEQVCSHLESQPRDHGRRNSLSAYKPAFSLIGVGLCT